MPQRGDNRAEGHLLRRHTETESCYVIDWTVHSGIQQGDIVHTHLLLLEGERWKREAAWLSMRR